MELTGSINRRVAHPTGYLLVVNEPKQSQTSLSISASGPVQALKTAIPYLEEHLDSPQGLWLTVYPLTASGDIASP